MRRSNLGNTLRLLGRLARLRMSAGMIYRLSFWGTFVADVCVFSVQLVFFGIIGRGGGVGDWTTLHLVVFTGSYMALDGLYMALYFFGTLSIPEQVRTGKLDLVLARPVNALLYVCFGHFDPGALLQFVLGLGLAAWGGAGLGLLSIPGALRYLAVLGCMAVLIFSLMFCLRCTSFWMVEAGAIYQLEETLAEFAYKLPAPAIQGAWRVVLYLLLPYGLMANLPASALFGEFGAVHWLVCLGVPGLFLTLGLLLWRAGLRRYESASS